MNRTAPANRLAPHVLVALASLIGLRVFAPSPAMAQPIAWTLREVSGPSPRAGNAMVYDSARRVAVLFGGGVDPDPETFDGQTWEWDGNAWTQRTMGGPSPRGDHAMAYDSDRHVCVLFGGWNGSACNGETWEWNGTAWTQRPVSGPSPRGGHQMVYDKGRGVVVLFGGWNTNGVNNSETWEWNGTAWTPRALGGPSPRGNHTMVFDEDRLESILFGGNNGNSGNVLPNNETWKWNGTVWTQLAGGGPSPRIGHRMAYDTARRRGVLFGGFNGTAVNGETWEWNGTAWTELAISGPAPRWAPAMAYDAFHESTVLFGGWDGTEVDDQTWELRNACCPSDFNCDGFVTGDDFDAYISAFVNGDSTADFNHDGFVTGDDFDAFAAAFEAGC